MTSPNHFRIAVLLCDTPAPAILSTLGDYGSIFGTLFRNSLKTLKASTPGSEDVDFVVDSYDVRNKQEYPAEADVYDAVLLTGSAASAYENVEWINRLVEYVRTVAESKPNVRLFGICFGHQIIGRALGGECVPNGGNWEIGPTKIQTTDIGKSLFGVSELNIQEMHRDHVPTVPPSFHLLASSPVCTNQGMVQLYSNASPAAPNPKDIHIFTVQGHPEFHKGITDVLVDLRGSSGLFSKEMGEDYRQRAEWRNDGVDVVGKAMWNILRASRD